MIKLNETELRKFIQFQIKNGINGVVPCGTTGEASTMSHDEKLQVIKITLDECAGKTPVIAGTGNNNTAETIAFTKEAQNLGAKAALVVTPYYNKPDQEGLFLHYQAIAHAVPDMAIVVYNVPSRTNVNILPFTMKRLIDACPNIQHIKEASGNLFQILELRRICGDDLTILSGEDALIWPYMAVGAKGVISVLSNIAPAETCELVRLGFAGKIKDATLLQNKLMPLVNHIFTEVNPIPVKYALNKMGFAMGNLRLPLHELSASTPRRNEQINWHN